MVGVTVEKSITNSHLSRKRLLRKYCPTFILRKLLSNTTGKSSLKIRNRINLLILRRKLLRKLNKNKNSKVGFSA
jgi:hypothetical protein